MRERTKKYFCEKCGRRIKKREIPWCWDCRKEILKSRLKKVVETNNKNKIYMTEETTNTPEEETPTEPEETKEETPENPDETSEETTEE